jgi:hypothetical protein
MNKRKQLTLLELCNKNKKKGNSSNYIVVTADTVVILTSTITYNKVHISNIEVNNYISLPVITLSVIILIRNMLLTILLKKKPIENKWKPSLSFKYSFSVHKRQKKKKKGF